jgi:hypothetical protein
MAVSGRNGMCGGGCGFMFGEEVLVGLLGGSEAGAVLALDVEVIGKAIDLVH